MLYRELKSYKFELAQTYQIQTEIFPEKQIVESYVGLGVDGLLTIFNGFKIDGVTHSITTSNVMRAAFVHDSLYYLHRKGSLNISYRPKVDLLFYNILLQDGTAKFRAWYMYQAVKNFGEKYALPTTEKDENEKIFRV